jgi:hypothetical protein
MEYKSCDITLFMVTLSLIWCGYRGKTQGSMWKFQTRGSMILGITDHRPVLPGLLSVVVVPMLPDVIIADLYGRCSLQFM